MSAPDWIQAGLLLAAVITLIYVARTFKDQTRGRDMENYLQLSERITTAWRKLGDAEEEDVKYFEFTELMNLFEAACDFHTRKILAGATRQMIREYLCDMLPIVFDDGEALKMITRAKTNPGTYNHILVFAREQRLAGVTSALETIQPARAQPES